MEWERLTTDELEQQLLSNRELRSRLDAEDIEILEVLDERQVVTADGSRSLAEWTAARLDIGLDTSRTLVRTMRRTSSRPDLRSAMGEGVLTLDRVEALSRLGEDSGHMQHTDIAGVRREASNRARMEADAEFRTSRDQFVVMQPTLDESWWKFWGGLDGPSGALVDKVLSERADELPSMPDGSKGDAGWRKAVALTELCVSEDAPPAQITVFVDAKVAAEAHGEAGVVLSSGVKAGRHALEAVLCDGNTEVIARTEDGRYLDYGRKSRTVPPALKRALLHKYGHRCAIDGCDGRHRLEAHHLVPWSEGGATNQDEMILVCWFHHHRVIHGRGFEPFADPEHGRIRLRRRST